MKENNFAIKQLLDLERDLTNRIYNCITEDLLRNRNDENTINNLKESLIYIVEEKMKFIKLNNEDKNDRKSV